MWVENNWNYHRPGLFLGRAISLLFFYACSAHNPFILTSTTQSSATHQQKYAAHNDKVFITELSLPASVEFELISTIDVGKVWYGSSK
jgi:hypothetical protein